MDFKDFWKERYGLLSILLFLFVVFTPFILMWYYANPGKVFCDYEWVQYSGISKFTGFIGCVNFICIGSALYLDDWKMRCFLVPIALFIIDAVIIVVGLYWLSIKFPWLDTEMMRFFKVCIKGSLMVAIYTFFCHLIIHFAVEKPSSLPNE